MRVWDTEILTSEEGVREVLSFTGIPREDQQLIRGQRPSGRNGADVKIVAK